MKSPAVFRYISTAVQLIGCAISTAEIIVLYDLHPACTTKPASTPDEGHPPQAILERIVDAYFAVSQGS